MTPPIRTLVHTLVEFPKEPEEMTLREVTEWYKRCVQVMQRQEMMSGLESKYINERWALLVAGVAKREGIPAGMLSYFLGELANTELQLVDTATRELEGQRVSDVS